MNTLVETRCGAVQGIQEDAVRVWRGTPYAQAHVGELRFRAPQPLAPWLSVRAPTGTGMNAPTDEGKAEGNGSRHG